MLQLIARRLLVSIPLVFIVTGISFVLLGLLPGNAAVGILGQHATPEQIAALERQLGLDRPLYEQYWSWLTGVLHGNFGTSLISGEEVFPTLITRLQTTLSLVLLSLAVAVVVGVAIGVLTARNRGVLGKVVDVLAIGGLAVPSFWLALVLVLVFAVNLGWLPATGYQPLAEGIGGWIWFLELPVVSLAVGMITSVAKQTRDSMLDMLASPYVIGLRANGISESRIIFKHALRNAAIPVVTVVGLLFVGSLTGAVVAEQIFALPGIGSLVVSATAGRDLPTIQGAALLLTLVVVVVNVIIDLAYGWLNPKVRNR